MANRSHLANPPSALSYSGSINRKLGLAVASLLFLILAVGGLSSFKAWSILTIAKKIQNENHDLKVTEDIHATLHHVIHEVDRAVLQGKLDRGSHLTEVMAQAARTITAFLDDHLNEPEPFHEKAEEIAGIRALEEFYHRVDAATSRIIERVAANTPASPEDLEVLDVIAHELPVVTQQTADAHQAKIRRLIASGVGKLMVILIAYMAFLVVGGGCGAAGIVVFSQTVSLPLRRLASATLDIASGNFEKRVPIISRDEIGQLSQSFNDMAARLERREEEIRETQVELKRQVEETRALSRIGVEISSMLDIGSILRSVVEKAQALLQCQGAALCLFGSKGEGLEVPVVSGSVEGSNVRPGEGDCGCPIKTTGYLKPGSVSCCACMTWKEGLPATCLTAALRRGDAVLGILCVGRKEPWAFETEDQELLDGLAAQAAIAIENARLYKEVGSLATVQERERIAREIHDSLAQAVGFLHLRLKTLEDRLGRGSQPPSLAELADMRTIAKKAYEDVRQSIFGLRTVASKERGLIPILTEYLRDFSQQSGVQAEFRDGNLQATRFSPEAEVQLVRVIQEALANVRKHARAHRAWVQFTLDGDMGCVTIADDGIGFRVESMTGNNGKRFGLRTMRERAEGLGGSLEILSTPGRGTQVVARIPLAKQGSDM
jgi:signal transduction histidine kinase